MYLLLLVLLEFLHMDGWCRHGQLLIFQAKLWLPIVIYDVGVRFTCGRTYMSPDIVSDSTKRQFRRSFIDDHHNCSIIGHSSLEYSMISSKIRLRKIVKVSVSGWKGGVVRELQLDSAQGVEELHLKIMVNNGHDPSASISIVERHAATLSNQLWEFDRVIEGVLRKVEEAYKFSILFL